MSAIEGELEALRTAISTGMPGNPAALGWKSYSQSDEDGIIRECLARIARVAPLSRTFFEIGCGNGLENNTHLLLLDGYRGGWIDGSADNIASIKEQLGSTAFDDLLVMRAFVTAENARALATDMAAFLGTQDIDLLSLDIDGNDTYVMSELLLELRPKLICVEYNAKFRPPTSLTMAYDASHWWKGGDYFGASLQYWVEQLTGYRLVCCNLSGANAFFVRDELAEGFPVYSVEQLFQPARYRLAETASGHGATLQWLADRLAPGRRAPWLVDANVPHFGRFPFEIHRCADQYISGDLARDEIWEAFETEVFRRVCMPGDRVLDIGANIGWYSVLASRLVGESGHVRSFEPDSANGELLARNLARNCAHDNVRVERMAVGARSEQLNLFRSGDNLGDHRLFDDGSSRETSTVPVEPLDRLYDDSAELPTLIKSDTQGSEGRILEGAAQLLAAGWRPVWLLEFWPYGLANSGSDAMAVWRRLDDLGYRMFEVSEGNPALIELDEARVRQRLATDLTVESTGFINILALPGGGERLERVQDLIQA